MRNLGKINRLYPDEFAWFLGMFAYFHYASMPFNYLCESCGNEFGIRTTLGKVSLGLLLILLVMAISAVVVYFSRG